MMSGLNDLFSAKAKKIEQDRMIRESWTRLQTLYGEFAWVVMNALSNVEGVETPFDISEVVTQNSLPGRMIFRVMVMRGTGANPHVATNIRNAIYNDVSRRYNLTLSEVHKKINVQVQGDNISILY